MSQAIKFGPPVITVDVEDWPQGTWDHSLPITSRSADNTRRLLSILEETGVRATMFVLGRLAEAFPEVVREIDGAGHEVASHGYEHVEIFKQAREEFTEDIRRSKDVLEQILGHSIRGYRAPDFSIVPSTLWALEVLAEAGFEYDSSIFPIHHPRYGIPNWPVIPVRVPLSGQKSIVEFPIATLRFLGKNWPVGGGGYHRLLPGFVSRRFARSIIEFAPFVFYCHPYEFDPLEFQEIAIKIPLHVRLHQGLGRRRFVHRFKAFIRQFGGQRMVDLFLSNEWSNVDSFFFKQVSSMM